MSITLCTGNPETDGDCDGVARCDGELVSDAEFDGVAL